MTLYYEEADRLFTPQNQGLGSEDHGVRRVSMRAYNLSLSHFPQCVCAWQGRQRMSLSIVEAWTKSRCGASSPIATIWVLAH